MAQPKLQYAIGNAASTTLSVAAANSDTSLTLTSDTNFAAKSGEGMVMIDEAQATEELAYSTGKSGAVLTVPLANRGLEGGSAQGHAINATVKGVLTVGMWNDLIDTMLDLFDQTTGVLDTTKVVTPTGTQTLTNKTLTSPTLNTPTIAGGVFTGNNAGSSEFPKFSGIYDCGTVGAAETVSWNNGDRQKLTLDENLTITFSNATAGQTLTLYLLQDGSGTNTITFADTITWADATTPTWTTTANKLNIAVIFYDGSGYYGVGNKFA